MASRILHLAVADKIMEQVPAGDKNRFRLGMVLPDAYSAEASKTDSHLKITVCGGTKKTYDLRRFRREFGNLLYQDELYLGYYLHLIQDMVFRRLVYEKYNWNPLIPGNVERLHRDYHLANRYVIEKYGLNGEVRLTDNFEKEKIHSLYPFDADRLLHDLENDFAECCEGKSFFFTRAMADEFMEEAKDICLKEIAALRERNSLTDEYDWGWRNKCVSLLRTTQNTRELGGYRTRDGRITKWNSLIRSDVQNYPCAEDLVFLKEKGITTIIDMRGRKDVAGKPSGFDGEEDFTYINCPIDEGSRVPDSADAVPESYMNIARAANIAEVFKNIANAKGGVMFNCTAGKDRTGVVSAILLYHAGVEDADIIENYVLTKEYGKERLDLVHKNYPDIDMRIVTPNEMFMEAFLRLFRKQYKNTHNYFKKLGLSEEETEAIYSKMVD